MIDMEFCVVNVKKLKKFGEVKRVIRIEVGNYSEEEMEGILKRIIAKIKLYHQIDRDRNKRENP